MTTSKEAGNIPAPLIEFFAAGLEHAAAAFHVVLEENNPEKKRK